MSLETEKKAVIKKFELVDDIHLVRAIRNMLDYALNKSVQSDPLEVSIKKGLEQSDRGEGRPHKEVMAELRDRYKI